ncbi:hypothetical protein R9C00_05665 [Flammeovirgaceae bacterium SG7u.111]|nr:hypothetical protein [Flammeovirgaceae bacterium SG7u.132]WPO36928.1 hypothetical protein R9C00_05665 [Flammeovirgaceae bacterium SG7u.111]
MSKDHKILFKGETITIVLHKSPAYLEMIFYGYTHSEEFRRAWNTVLDFKNTKDFSGRILLDQYYMHVQPDDFAWCMKEWFPKAVKKCSPKSSVAIIPAVNFVGNFQVKEDSKEVQTKYPDIKVQFFENFDGAIEWLEKR